MGSKSHKPTCNCSGCAIGGSSEFHFGRGRQNAAAADAASKDAADARRRGDNVAALKAGSRANFNSAAAKREFDRAESAARRP